ncbi:hypothetical protein [Macrococcus sp. DPC7161]|uniref:hypothetical protein n=1 Tax=Macrococcus sp. DPC7161 TaxID=2507060 RepID=UPI00100B8C72|nr:hypothetical protein [Macrococcus sp. DPC7161]RXK19097.1 hypothetical protein ER639_01930 [Macrococcus sp. DPC7161]
MSDIKDSYTLEALLTGDNSRLRKVIDQAVVMLERLEKRDADDIKIDGDVKPLQKKVETAKRLSEQIDGLDAEVDFDADNSELNRKVKMAEASTKLLDGKKAQIEIIAKNTEAIAKMKQVRLTAKQLSTEKPKIDVDMDISAATSRAETFKQIIKSIPNKIKVRADVDTKKAQAEVEVFKKRIDSIDDKIRVLPALFAALSPAIIPIVSSIVPAIMAIGNAIAVVGGGAIGLAGAFGIAGAGVMAFGLMTTSALKMLKDGLLEQTKEVKNYQTALSGLKKSWENVIKSNQSKIFNTLTNSLKATRTILQQLTPFISGVASGMEKASKSFAKWTKNSPVAEKFFNMLNTTGVSVFDDIAVAAGKFGDGVVNIFTQFAPLFKFMSNGLKNIASDFQNWSNKVSTAKGIQDFINYTKKNLPVIGRIFGNTFLGLFNLFKAFGSNSQVLFGALDNLTAKFKEWSDSVGKSQGFKDFVKYAMDNGGKVVDIIGNLAGVFVNLGVALAPLGSTVLNALKGITDFANKFSEAHPHITAFIGAIAAIGGVVALLVKPFLPVISIIGQTIEAFGGFEVVKDMMIGVGAVIGDAIAAISLPVLGVIAAIALLIGALVGLYNYHQGFRDAINAAWEAIKTSVMTAIQAVKDFVMQTFEGLLTWWQQNQDLFLTTFQNVWNNLSTVVSVALAVLTPIIQGAWETIKVITQVAWEFIKGIITIAIEVIKGVLVAFFQLLNGDFAAAWETVKQTVFIVWETIKQTIMNALTIITEFLVASWENIKTIITTVMTAIWTVITTIWTTIWTTITTLLQSIVDGVVNGFNTMWTTITSIMQSIWDAIVNAWNSIVNTISNAINSAINFVSNGFNQMLSTVTSIMQSIWNAVVNAWNNIVNAINNGINQAVNFVRNGFSQMISAVVNFASQLVSNITSAMSRFTSAVRDGASQALSAIKNGVSQMISAVRNGAGDMASAGVDFVRGFVRGIEGQIKNAADAAARMAQSAVAAAKKFLHIASPSKLMKKIGAWTSEGFAIGIMKKVPQVISASKEMASKATQAITKMKTGSYDKAKTASKAFYDVLTKQSKNASTKLASNNKKIAAIQQKLKGKLWNKTRANLNKQLVALMKENKAFSYQKKAIESLKKSTKKSTQQLANIAKKRESVADKLKKAQDKLKAIKGERDKFKESIKDNLTNYGAVSSSDASTSQGLIADLNERYKAVKEYANNINKLKKKGVHADIIRDLLEAGISGGSKQASILANANSDTIQQVNYLQKQISGVASGLATKQAKEFYGVGINAAQGLVDGLKKQDKALVAAATRIANTITNTVKKKLGIHSPSRVFMGLGGHTVGGYIEGILRNKNAALRTMSNLATKVSNAFSPQFTNAVPNLTSNLNKATSNIASKVNADVVNTVRNEPVGVTLNANLSLGNRDYNAFVGDITDNQNATVRLREVYDV